MKHVLLATAAALALADRTRGCATEDRQDRLHRHLQRAGGGARQRHAQFVRDRPRSAGRKLGGLPVEVIYEDDQIKPEVGVQKTQKLIESDKVDFLVGYIWSNVLLGVAQARDRHQDLPDHHQAGPSQIAGELCSPYVFSTSWENDQRPAAVGTYLTKKGFKNSVPDRAELRRRQGPDRRASSRITRAGGRQGADPLAGPARLLGGTRQGQSASSPMSCSRSIRARPARSS